MKRREIAELAIALGIAASAACMTRHWTPTHSGQKPHPTCSTNLMRTACDVVQIARPPAPNACGAVPMAQPDSEQFVRTVSHKRIQEQGH